MTFSFDDDGDRAKLERELSARYDHAFKAGDFTEVLRLNALIERCWLRDDKNPRYVDPMMRLVIENTIREWKLIQKNEYFIN